MGYIGATFLLPVEAAACLGVAHLRVRALHGLCDHALAVEEYALSDAVH